MEEENVVNSESNEPRVQLGPHPLGGIAVSVRDPAGETLQTRIDLPEAAILYAHLGALMTMGFQTIYAQAAMAQQGSGLITPGGKHGS